MTESKPKKKRPAYKPLFLRAKAEARENLDRAHLAEHEIRRLQGILAKAGERDLMSLPVKDKGPLKFSPLPYECATAFIRSHSQVREAPYYTQGWMMYSWRGRTLMVTR